MKKEKEKDDETVILTIRCKDAKHRVMFGSEKRPCVRCGELVWVSPIMKNEKMKAVCIQCLTEKERAECNIVVKGEVIEAVIEELNGLKYSGFAG